MFEKQETNQGTIGRWQLKICEITQLFYIMLSFFLIFVDEKFFVLFFY